MKSIRVTKLCVNVCKSPDDLKGTPILRGPNSPTQGISDLLNNY